MIIKQKIKFNVNRVFKEPYLIKDILLKFSNQSRVGYSSLELNEAYISSQSFNNLEKKYNTLLLYSQGEKHITVKIFREPPHRASGAKLDVSYLAHRPSTVNLLLRLKDKNKILSEKIISLEDLY